jgi:hypothetical protein
MSDSTETIKSLIFHIEECAHQIARYNTEKQRSEEMLKDMLCHTKHGAHTHEFLDYKITITIGSNLTLDKNAFYEYLTGAEKIDARYEVVKPVSSYELNKKAITNLELFGSQEDIALKNKFIRATEKKLHVKIVKADKPISSDVYDFSVDGVLTDDISQ